MSSTPGAPTPTPSSSGKLKIAVWVILAAVVVGFVAAFVIGRTLSNPASDDTASPDTSATQGTTADAAPVVREDSRVLSQAPQEKAVLVEFLDFECEGCAAAYPFVEELRAEHSENLTVVHRYFPLPGHPNSMTAAIAVEAAAQQDAYEAMYQRMFETQTDWSHSAEDRSPVFRGYAEDLGLDMEAYDAAVADPATQARIEQDVADGQALGVQGTPTFFLDGEPLTVDSLDDFRAEVAAAAAD